jgi:hypothetical protein
MTPVMALMRCSVRKQIVAFVGATPMVAKVGSNNLVSTGNIQFVFMMLLGRPDFLEPALMRMYKRQPQFLLRHQLIE